MKLYISIFVLTFTIFTSCSSDYLDLKPTDKVTAEAIFSSPEGIKVFMANLYSQLPIEDFNSTPNMGLSYNVESPNNGGVFPFILTDDGIGSQNQAIAVGGGNDFPAWNESYKLNRDINILLDVVPNLSIDEKSKKSLIGEAAFIRAYTYFALAIRYGGVPIITKLEDKTQGVEGLKVPRSTEKETWDFILASCDTAAMLLGDDDGTRRRASKWAALALKSRAALHAASIAKYWNLAPLSGVAVDKGLVGINKSEANRYYKECIDASAELINSRKYSLYKASPTNPIEAEENYRQMFEDANRAINEVIFIKGFTLTGTELGHNVDNWGNPNQTTGAWPHPGRFNPSLDLVDAYEEYSKPGMSAPIITTEDGDYNNYSGYDPKRKYLTFNDPTEIFANKDARLKATTIIPGSVWKGTKIIIQGGLIKPDGTAIIEAPGSFNVNGQNYYTYGAADPALYSGFGTFGSNMTRTGFGFKKWLNSQFVPILGWNFSTQDWIEFRYAEVLLNYAEAVGESGQGDPAIAEKAINDLRRRAGHTVDIPLKLENVLRERRVELAFENRRYWDLTRRREYHTRFNAGYRHALVPVFDLRSNKYIFIRKNVLNTIPRTWIDAWYYKTIPGVGTSGLIQNPQY